ncbi:MAG: hypothetical protein ABIP71_12485 [Verrucomicrobiota bacterium]
MKQNDVFRDELLAESDNLRGVAGLAERGRSFYQAALKVKKWTSPFSFIRRSNGLTSKVLGSCVLGLKFLRQLRKS